jgi:NADH:ubiquinone oxidoreductase subunit E
VWLFGSVEVGLLVDAVVQAIVAKHKPVEASLMSILKELNQTIGYLKDDHMKEVALSLDLPVSKVYGVATFYTLYSTVPKGEHIVRVCDSAPCHVKGAESVVKAIQDFLGVKPGETTADGRFTLEFSSCLGICGVAPAFMVDDTVYGNLTPERVPEILSSYWKEG